MLVGMNTSKPSRTPVFEESDGPILVGILNQLVESFDAEELSREATLLLYVLLDRALKTLWQQYPSELMELYRHKLMAAAAMGDDEEPDSSDDTGGH
jgi:hypothetical protein